MFGPANRESMGNIHRVSNWVFSVSYFILVLILIQCFLEEFTLLGTCSRVRFLEKPEQAKECNSSGQIEAVKLIKQKLKSIL